MNGRLEQRQRPVRMQAAAGFLLLFLFMVAGCEGPVMLPVTPNVLRGGAGEKVLQKLPAARRIVDLPVLYVTDRATAASAKTATSYGLERSPSLAYGVATVSLDPAPSWNELAMASGTDGQRFQLKVSKIEERGKINVTPASVEMYEGNLRFRPEVREMITRENARLLELVSSHLATSNSKDVYVYVHGVNNTFEDAIRRAAIIWHSIGRQGVVIAYAWPAGEAGGRGYFRDRESGEYTVLHLKRLLAELAKCPDVERIHVIAHSRGCDISTTALRELNIECRARGESTQKELKLETLVLAAADMDVEVFGLRVAVENMAVIAKRFVVYSSSKDELVAMADWIFHSRARLGMLSKEDIGAAEQAVLAQVPNMELVQCVVSGFGTTHDYVFTNPGALSDLILVLRDGKNPGEANGRPLTPLGGAFWKLDNNYALPAAERHHP